MILAEGGVGLSHHLKLSDISISLFVEFCVLMVIGTFGMIFLKPYVSQEESARLVAFIVLGIVGPLTLILTGAGWQRKLNRLFLLIMGLMGWLLLSAGLLGYLGIYTTLTIPIAFAVFLLGRQFSDSKWIDRVVIIKRWFKVESVLQEEEFTEF